MVRPLEEMSFVALDTETTGLSYRTCHLVEVAAVRFDVFGNVTGRYAQLIDPCCPIPRAAMAVHGITDEMVAGMPTVDFVLPAFFEFLEAQDSVIVIHNAPFDIGFIREAARRIGNRCPKHPIIDTLWMARRRVTELPRHRLDMLINHFGEGSCAEHRAAGDAEMLRRIFLKMLRREPAIETTERLLTELRFKYFDQVVARPARRVTRVKWPGRVW
jgi:DNA polymerase III epsilon subunit family exonuclease